MATTLKLSKASGYPTEDSMRVNVSFTVTYAGDYYAYFELYDSDDNLVDEAMGNTYTLEAGATKSGIYKTFTGLEASTSYYIIGSLWNASTDTRLDITEPKLSFKTLSAFEPPTIYIATTPVTMNTVTLNCEIEINDPVTVYVVFHISYLGTSQDHTSSSFSTTRGLTWKFSDIPNDTQVSCKVSLYDYDTDDLYGTDKATVTTLGASRPANWEWTSNVSKGASMPYTRSGKTITCKPLTASEWNEFVDRVVVFREYLGLSAQDLSAFYVSPGDAFDTEVPEAMRQFLDGMNPPTAVPSAISSGKRITAAFFNGLKNSLNSFK